MLLLSSCSLAPDFALPQIEVPERYKEEAPRDAEEAPEAVADTAESRKAEVDAVLAEDGAPIADAQVPAEDAAAVAEGEWKASTMAQPPEVPENWWTVFDDPALNALMDTAMEDSPTLAAALARLDQARASADIVDSDRYPQVGVDAGVTRTQRSQAQFGPGFPGSPPFTVYSAQAYVSFDPDVFGALRDRADSAFFEAEASAAEVRAVLLSLQADLAQNYFRLRALDLERAIVNEGIALREESLKLARIQEELGETNALETTQFEAEWLRTRGEAVAIARSRAQVEHAIAVLIGRPPSEIERPEDPLTAVPPEVPAGIPSTLLERRPDILAAQYAMAAANERIGTARAAFFPVVGLTAQGGFQSESLGDLFQWSSRAWSLGPLLSLPIFTGGRNTANLALAKADWREQVADYRQSVLTGFREVEDELSNLRLLKRQAEVAEQATASAARAEGLARLRYDEGYSLYFELLDAQRTALEAKRASVQILGSRYVSTIQLIRALGGGWGEAAPVADASGQSEGAAMEPPAERPAQAAR